MILKKYSIDNVRHTARLYLRDKPLYYFLLFFQFVFQFCNIREKVVFSNFNGKGYGDNPKYIADEIIKRNLKYDLVWLVNDLNNDLPSPIRKIKFNSIKAVYELSTAKVIVNNVKNGLPYKKKNSQYYIQTWHGCFPLKYIEKEAEEMLGKSYIKKTKADSAITDLLLSGCKTDTEIYKNSFWYNGEIFEQGIPRNDILFGDNDAVINNTKRILGISDNTKIVLYAPTFRDDNSFDAYSLDYKKVVSTLESKTKEKWAMVVRLHPNVDGKKINIEYTDSIFNGSIIPDSQHLVISSDMLITDYSSMMFDFFLMKKPVILFAPDFFIYSEERGLRPIYNQLPSYLCLNNEELTNIILTIDFDDYLMQAEKFIKDNVHSYDDGHASERVVDRIIEVMTLKKLTQIQEFA